MNGIPIRFEAVSHIISRDLAIDLTPLPCAHTTFQHDTLAILIELTAIPDKGSAVYNLSTSIVPAVAVSERIDCPAHSVFYNIFANPSPINDFTVITTEKSIPVVKVMLYARSPVFQAMLGSAMAEAAQQTLSITDFPCAVVEIFLLFLYTDRCEEASLDLYSTELFKIANKYQVQELVEVTLHHLLKTVTLATLRDRVTLAWTYETLPLKKRIVDFVKKNLRQVATMSEGFADLPSELLEAMLLALAGEDYTKVLERRVIEADGAIIISASSSGAEVVEAEVDDDGEGKKPATKRRRK
jgi:hypothetical protein